MNNTNVTEESKEIPLGKFIGISVAVLSSIGTVANALVLSVLSISQRRRFTPYRYLISHLAASDFCCSIFLLVYVPLELRSHQWIYSKESCKLIYPAITFFTNIAVGTMLIISVERFRGVMFPHFTAWKPRNVWIALTTVWIVGLLIIIPNILTIKITPYKNIDYCNETWKVDSIRKAYGISFFLCAFFIPLSAIIIMHVGIIIRLKKRNLYPDNVSNYRHKTDARITRVLTAIIISFFICILPNKLLYFVWDIAPHLENNKKVLLYLRTIQALYYLRVALDPILYCFFDTRFKKDFRYSIKSIRGESFNDSDFISRSRSRTVNRSRAPTILEQRSRTGTHTSNEGMEYNTHGLETALAAKLSTLQETELKIAASDMNLHVDYSLDQRCRSTSCYTDNSLYGSASPLVRPMLVTAKQESLTQK